MENLRNDSSIDIIQTRFIPFYAVFTQIGTLLFGSAQHTNTHIRSYSSSYYEFTINSYYCELPYKQISYVYIMYVMYYLLYSEIPTDWRKNVQLFNCYY